ncbi:hypothetical protein [Streptomyces venezuelae]|uniref:hypothetical protein n=1 Tax=Streptomyces venezuelae TaxID=54571 RepID=UPI001F2AF8F1|nr:hypothetical protein [Streptomyces venezuelae]
MKPHATASALRDYQHDGVRVISYATAIGSILIVTTSKPTDRRVNAPVTRGALL